MTDALIIVTLAMALGVAIYEVTLIRSRFRREDTAEVTDDRPRRLRRGKLVG